MVAELLTVDFPGTLGMIGAVLLALSTVAALVLNWADKRRKSAVTANGSVAATPVAAKAEIVDTREHCSILFGTQTGTAERFAKSLKSQLESKYGASTVFDVVDVENYIAENLVKEKLVFFLMATYGDGEPTDNAADFYNWLLAQAKESSMEAPLCENVSFGVFGLGNRQYEHFCAVGKHIQKAMKELGATPVVRIGTGDDDDDIEEDFEAWSADLFTALEASPLLKAGSAAAATPDSVPAYLVEAIKDAPMSAIDVMINGNGLTTSSPHLATITLVKELHTSLSDRSCVHVEVDISNSSATYEAGDHVGVFAENSPEVAAAAAKVLGLPLDMCFTLRTPSAGPSTSLPAPPGAAGAALTLRHALAHYADVLSSPDKGALSALAAFAINPEEAAKLNQLASIEGRDTYHSYIVASKRSLLEIMQEFPSARPTLGAFFGSIAPRLQPRYYSISSSPVVHPRSVHITAAVVKETMPTGRVHHGVATSWLAAAKAGTKVPVVLRHSAFKLPKDQSTPVVMIGPGTGLAPFRGFIQERAAAVVVKKSKNTILGPGVLFFGCRREDQDYIYKEELETAVANGALSELNIAFSRQAAVKDYVQHHLKRQGKAVWDLLGPKGKGYLYVCGDAKNMAKDVHAALIEIATEAADGNAVQGEAAVKELLDSGRYQKDVW
ncbi:hypothetical protein Ndes2437B_g06058 [Nannochloris sp. 'desiccata']|nr:hypothetical protein KSW81_008006 [Chlorella desiccata (nom. nud.)]